MGDRSQSRSSSTKVGEDKGDYSSCIRRVIEDVKDAVSRRGARSKTTCFCAQRQIATEPRF